MRLAAGLEAGGLRFPGLVARFGADLYGFAARWLADLETSMRDGG